MRMPTALFAAALAGCSGLPPHVSVPDAVVTDGRSAEFTRCALGVTFTGLPRKLGPNETPNIARSIGNLPKFTKWEINGLVWEETRRGEGAVCLCAASPLTPQQRSNVEASVRNANEIDAKRIDVPFSLSTTELQRPIPFGGPLVSRLRYYFPSAAPACFLFQVAVFEPGAPLSGETFLGSTRPATLR